jgi:hypothetical protein
LLNNLSMSFPLLCTTTLPISLSSRLGVITYGSIPGLCVCVCVCEGEAGPSQPLTLNQLRKQCDKCCNENKWNDRASSSLQHASPCSSLSPSLLCAGAPPWLGLAVKNYT